MQSLKPTLIAIWLPFAAATGAFAAVVDGTAAADTKVTAAAPAASTAGAKDAQGPELGEIVVTGLRASLEKSLDVKKNASVVLDSINAEELGRFPDADVADSLNHLPGITISRTTGGEGQKVSVRGFGPQYNIVTLNNRILATDDDARDLAFDVLPSEVISGADVLKSSEASALEGSIGGTVNLRTASPFDNAGLHGGVHAEGNYNDMSTLYGHKFSAFASDTMLDHTLGFLIGGVVSDNKTRTDSLNAYNQSTDNGSGTYPFDGSIPSLVATPCCITMGSIFDEKKREALSGSLEWRPSDTFKLVADGLWTKLEDPQIGYNQSYYFPYGTDQNGNPTWSNPVVQNGVITAVTSNNFTPEIVNNTLDRNVVTSLYGLKGSWQPTDKFKLDFDAYRSTASRPEGGNDTFLTAGLVSATPYSPDIITITDVAHSLPNLNVAIPPSQLGLTACPNGTASTSNTGYCSYTSLMNSGFLNNNKYWSTHYDGLSGYSVHDQVTGFTLDGAYHADLGFFDKLLFGAGYNHREKSRADVSNDWNNGSAQYGTLYTTAGCPLQCNPYTFASQGFNVISFTSPPNFLKGAGGSYPSILPKLNSAQLLAFLASLNGQPNPSYCTGLPCSTPFDLAGTLPQANPFNSYDVTEKTFSFYTEATFAGTNWSGNLGVRVLRTTTMATTAENVPVDLWTLNGANSVQSFNVDYSSATQFAEQATYTLALPSLNLNYWVVPDKLQARAAVSETMSRPDLNQLAPNATNQAINGTPILIYTGAAGLKPIKAWSADLSLEWYYRPHSALNGALFGKKVMNDIYSGVTPNVDLGTKEYVGGQPGTVPGTPFLWSISAPANGAKETFTGVELSWQHFLDNGLGTHMQFTHTWSKGYDQFGNPTGAVNAAPPTTFSMSLIYDKGPFNVDVNWDYTSRYTYVCSQCTEVPFWPAIADPFSWVTASAHYRFFKGFEVYVEGKNLTNAIARSYLNGNPLLPWANGFLVGQSASGVGGGYSAYGRSFVFGASYRF
ncbi:MAG TPA: TonB-dependent receptor [Steroidobacteraceae bacterium]|nr:TonB-dependent receptor [Steroidobacteraceae bacterium]